MNDQFGTTIVLIRARHGRGDDISDRVVVLDYGKKIGDGVPDDEEQRRRRPRLSGRRALRSDGNSSCCSFDVGPDGC